jgi:hypothetical protein
MEPSNNPRVMLQPRKSVLRDALRNAAERIEKLTAELLWWQEHHEQAVADALTEQGGLPRWGWLVLAALGGGFAGAIVEAVLA